MSTTIQLRRDTSTNWTTNNPTLALAEVGVETNTNKIKIGNGSANWNTLGYFGSGGDVDWFNVVTYGADHSGTTDSTSAIQAAIAAAIATTTGGVVYFPAGKYKVSSTLTALIGDTQSVKFVGDGHIASVLYYYGTGDCIRMYNNTTFTGSNHFSARSGIIGLGVDGTNATGSNAAGIHVGDILALQLDVFVSNFSGTGGIGVHLDNAKNWTEESDLRIISYSNSNALVAEVTLGSNSFGYTNLDLTVIAGNNTMSGLVLKNGATMYHSNVKIRGNFSSSVGTQTAAVIYMSGAGPVGSGAAGDVCSMFGCQLDVFVELGGSGNGPWPIWLDQTNYAQFYGNYGRLVFNPEGSAWTPSVYGPDQLQFFGTVVGDTSIGASYNGSYYNYLHTPLGQPTIYSRDIPTSTAETQLQVQTTTADIWKQTLAGNWTVALTNVARNNNETLGVPQRVTIMLTQAASGGPYTVTWPSSGTGTVTAPTVNWPGGVTPTMSQTASAVDIYFLETIDGATWYGRAFQGGRLATGEQNMILNTTYTLTSSTSAQQLFNGTTNGAITLQPGTYLFECEFDLSSLSATSGTFGFGFGGTATLGAVKFTANSFKSATPATPSVYLGTSATVSSSLNQLQAATTTTTGAASIKGVVRVTAVGTLIPQTALSVASAAVVGANSRFRIWPSYNSATGTFIGDWS